MEKTMDNKDMFTIASRVLLAIELMEICEKYHIDYTEDLENDFFKIVDEYKDRCIKDERILREGVSVYDMQNMRQEN